MLNLRGRLQGIGNGFGACVFFSVRTAENAYLGRRTSSPKLGGLMVMVTSLAHALGCGALRPNIANWMTGARVLMGSIDPGPACGTAPRGRSRRPGAPPSAGADRLGQSWL